MKQKILFLLISFFSVTFLQAQEFSAGIIHSNTDMTHIPSKYTSEIEWNWTLQNFVYFDRNTSTWKHFPNSDDQNIDIFNIDNSNTLTITIEDGNTKTVDLSPYVNTDDQTVTDFSITNDILTITLEDGNTKTVDLSSYLDNTDDQTVTDFSISGTTITITIEDGNTKTLDISKGQYQGYDEAKAGGINTGDVWEVLPNHNGLTTGAMIIQPTGI